MKIRVKYSFGILHIRRTLNCVCDSVYIKCNVVIKKITPVFCHINKIYFHELKKRKRPIVSWT